MTEFPGRKMRPVLHCYFLARWEPELEQRTSQALPGAVLSFVRRQELVAAARWWPAGRRAAPELILEYNAALAAASNLATVLPWRFGTCFPSESAIATFLEERRAELLAALDRLEGKVEMTLRGPLEPGATADERADRIRQTLRPLESRFEVQTNARGEAVLEITHLVERQDVAAYRERLEGQALEASGPRAPFHFLPQFLRLPVRSERRAGRARSAAAG